MHVELVGAIEPNVLVRLLQDRIKEPECFLLVATRHDEAETCEEIHSLAVSNFRLLRRICQQNICQLIGPLNLPASLRVLELLKVIEGGRQIWNLGHGSSNIFLNVVNSFLILGPVALLDKLFVLTWHLKTKVGGDKGPCKPPVLRRRAFG